METCGSVLDMISVQPTNHAKRRFGSIKGHIKVSSSLFVRFQIYPGRVTTICSGDNFLNHKEPQNGCQARGHSNLFIPSMLHGAPFGDDGFFSEEKHKKNMSTAIDQYIHRVDETPCMKTSIRLYQGVNQDHLFLQRRGKLLKFLQAPRKTKQN